MRSGCGAGRSLRGCDRFSLEPRLDKQRKLLKGCSLPEKAQSLLLQLTCVCVCVTESSSDSGRAWSQGRLDADNTIFKDDS